LLPDPYLQVNDPAIVETWNPANITVLEGGPFGRGGWNVSNNAGRIYKTDKIKLAVGQTATFAFAFEAAVNSNWRLQIAWFDAAGAQLGATVTGVTVNGSAAMLLALVTTTRPANAQTVQLTFSRASAAGTCSVWAVWAELGSSASLIPVPDAAPEAAEIIKLKTPNLFGDSYFQGISKIGEINEQLIGWLNTSVMTLVEVGDTFKTRRIDIQNATAGVSGRLDFALSALDVASGDDLTVAAAIATQGVATGRLQLDFYNSADVIIGATISGSPAAASATPVDVKVGAKVPANAVKLRVYLARSSGGDALEFRTLWFNKGVAAIERPRPKKFDESPARVEVLEGDNKIPKLRGKYPNPLQRLIGNASDPIPSVTIGTFISDKTNQLIRGRPSSRLAMAAAGTGTIRWDFANALNFGSGQNAVLAVYIDDPSKITSVGLEIYSQTTPSSILWSRSSLGSRCQIINDDGILTQPNTGITNQLKKGWNFLRWEATSGVLTNWGNVARIRIVLAATAATYISVGGVFIESPAKAKILFVQDGGYRNFFENGYPALRNRKLPCSWALNPAKIDDGSDIAGTMSLSELINGTTGVAPSVSATVPGVRDDGNSFFGEHSWARADLDPYSIEQMREDHLRCVRWFYKNGFGQIRFRGAHTQNSAPNAIAAQKNLADLNALATSLANTGGADTWPFVDRWNVKRIGISASNGEAPADLSYPLFAATFNQLVNVTKGLAVYYIHKIAAADNTNTVDTNPSLWTRFLALVDANAANLEYHSYETLQQALLNAGVQDSDTALAKALIAVCRTE
jgi:hypothetical protein